MSDCLIITGVEIRDRNWALLGVEYKANLPSLPSATTTEDIRPLLSSKRELREDIFNRLPLPVQFCSECCEPLMGKDPRPMCRRCWTEKYTQEPTLDNPGEGGL